MEVGPTKSLSKTSKLVSFKALFVRVFFATLKIESADLIFHLIVLLEYSGSSFEDVIKVLAKRMKDD